MRYFILFFSLFFLTSCGPGESDLVKTEDSKPKNKVEDDKVPASTTKDETEEDQDDDSTWGVRGAWDSFTELFSNPAKTADLSKKRQICVDLHRHCLNANKHDLHAAQKCRTEYMSCLEGSNYTPDILQ